MDKIKITNANDWNWYRDLVGEVMKVKDKYKYYDLGVQVYRPDGKINSPDVVEHEHYEVSE